MKRIAQIDQQGCGIACVAMIAGVSYQDARTILFPDDNISSVKHPQLRSALAHFGITLSAGRRLGKLGFDDLTQDGIIWTYVTLKTELWKHWTVWDASAQAILDPYQGDIGKRTLRLVSIFDVQRPKSLRKPQPVSPR